MDERDMEEEGKNREGDGWGIGIKKLFHSPVICIRNSSDNF
jgi:hypothetical protein